MTDLVMQDEGVVRPIDAGTTRKSFLRKAGVGGAAVLGGSAVLGSLARPAFAGDPDDGVSDVDVLNFALTLEYLEATFYTEALGGPGTAGVAASGGRFSRRDFEIYSLFPFSGFRRGVPDTYGLVSTIRDHETTHVAFLRSALGSAAVGPCTFDFSGALKDVRTFLATAQVLENTGVMAYDGAIRYIDKGDYLQAGAQIATVEARHAAYLNQLNGTSPFPNAFDMGEKPSQIYQAAKGFIVSCPPEVVALIGRLP